MFQNSEIRHYYLKSTAQLTFLLNLSFFRHSIILTERFTVNGWAHSREKFCIINTMLVKSNAWCFQSIVYLWTHGLHSLYFWFSVSKGGSKNMHFLKHTYTHTHTHILLPGVWPTFEKNYAYRRLIFVSCSSSIVRW